MDREKFLYELQARLQGRIPDKQLQAVMEYYTAYFDDAGPEREQEVLDGLGSPAQVSRQILGERALKDMDRKESRGVFKTLAVVLMAIFAAPIALPVALVFAILAVILVLLIAMAVAMVGVAGVCGVAGGVFVAVFGFRAILTSWATAVYFLGGGLFMVGMGFLLVLATLALGRLCIRGFIRLAGRVLRRKEVGA
ncbi:MAG: DUF1700 domain-containing protein [Oscillospiraceae bacterium]|nr:DUF1700 domain-containing protein [Oscillospiraceae bacterium]